MSGVGGHEACRRAVVNAKYLFSHGNLVNKTNTKRGNV